MSYLLSNNVLGALLAALAGFGLTWLWMVRKVEGQIARTTHTTRTTTGRLPGADVSGKVTGAAAAGAAGVAGAAAVGVDRLRDKADRVGDDLRGSVDGLKGDLDARIDGGTARVRDLDANVDTRLGADVDARLGRGTDVNLDANLDVDGGGVGGGIGDRLRGAAGAAAGVAAAGVAGAGAAASGLGDRLKDAGSSASERASDAAHSLGDRVQGAADSTGAHLAGAGAVGAGALGAATGYAQSRFGVGSVEPLADGSMPVGYAIKGNADSMLFHTPDSPGYKQTKAEVWFASEEAARAAGFRHWDPKRR